MLKLARVTAIAAITIAGLAATGLAETPAQPALKSPLGASISGWTYELHRAGTSTVHFHFCQTSACVQGSKVSYIILPPDPGFTFPWFQNDKKKAFETVKKSAPPDTSMSIGEPTETQNGPLRIMRIERRETAPDGSGLTTVSGVLVGRTIAFSLISSSPDANAANRNFDFYVLLCVAVALKGEISGE